MITTSSANFYSYWEDEEGLSGYILSTNLSGSMVNRTWTAFSANPQWDNVTISASFDSYVTIQYLYYLNDTDNNCVVTVTQTSLFITGDIIVNDGISYGNYYIQNQYMRIDVAEITRLFRMNVNLIRC
jgi:hypothetical protein